MRCDRRQGPGQQRAHRPQSSPGGAADRWARHSGRRPGIRDGAGPVCGQVALRPTMETAGPTAAAASLGRQRWLDLGVAVDATDIGEALAWAEDTLGRRAGGWVATPNPEQVVAAWHNARLARALASAAICLPDGVGLIWASRILGGPLRRRVTGIEFLEGCLAVCAVRGWPVFFFGGGTGSRGAGGRSRSAPVARPVCGGDPPWLLSGRSRR